MSETLVIRLRAADETQAAWLIVDENGARSGSVQTGPLADAAPLGAGRNVVLLVPGSDVTLAEPDLPVRSRARLAQTVPYALEEQLASDVEGLHFAIGSKLAASTGTPVAIVARSLMDRWVSASAAAGIRPAAAYAETAVVPETPNGCTVLLDGSSVYVRRADALPFMLEADPLPDAFELALDAPGGAPSHVTFFAGPTDYERHREVIEGLRSRAPALQVKLLPDGPLPLLASQCARATAVNLLQGPYESRSSVAGELRRWRLPAVLAASVALVFVVTQVLSAWQLARTERKLDAEISQVFAQALPGEKVVNPRAQMEGLLGGGGGRSALLPTVSALSRALVGVPQARVQSLNCRGDTVDVRLAVPSVDSLDAITKALTAGGLSAKLQSATPQGAVVEGRLVVSLARS